MSPTVDYVNVTVRLGVAPPLLLNGHGTSQGVPIMVLACGEFNRHNLPLVGTRYDITLAQAAEPANRFTIKLYCTFAGGTSEFKVNPK